MNIGQTIKRLRQQKNMTQEQLAQLLCVSAAAVSKWEVGNT
ncbi:MAG: helix-turn-helix transcriptional regulator, partial [Clostridia bacterium]|nr:helix-turn-helix transcriptional regulator [Clostridia bacterium]